MSLFDVLKYTLSTPPTTEQLSALPEVASQLLMRETGWAAPIHQAEFLRIAYNHSDTPYKTHSYENTLNRIRKLIYEL